MGQSNQTNPQLNTIITGDSLEILRHATLPPIHLIFTSPEYPGQYGNTLSSPEWIEWLINDLMPLLLKHMAPNAVLAINIFMKRLEGGWFNKYLFKFPTLLEEAYPQLNWLETNIYHKKNVAPNGPLDYADFPAWEPIFIFTTAPTPSAVTFNKQRKPYRPRSITSNGTLHTRGTAVSNLEPNENGARQTNVFHCTFTGQNRPYANGKSFPCQLAQEITLRYTNPHETILDPFCGVGTSCKVAHLNQRNYIGIEIDPSEAKSARQWLQYPGLAITDNQPLPIIM